LLSQADFPVATGIELLARRGVEAAFLVPTRTGLEKSILDAHEELRRYLAAVDFHNFDTQPQGQQHKVKHRAFLVHAQKFEETQVSLYRATDRGDPRVWLGRAIRDYAVESNLLAITVVDRVMYVLNMSDPSVQVSLDDEKSPFRLALARAEDEDQVVGELLDRLRSISGRGFIPNLREGDTGVGFTLETQLGISANSSKSPDYKGIEIKSRRNRLNTSQTRSTLFSKVPNWQLSPIGKAIDLVKARGYLDKDGRLSLYHTLSAAKINSLGLALDLDLDSDWLKQVYHDSKSKKVIHDTTWVVSELRNDLLKKHRETFWVKARTRGRGEGEEFHYVEVQHTRSPLAANFVPLLEAGIITVDYTLHKRSETRARDHGYLFKIHPDNLEALFPPPKRYSLC